MGNEIKYAELFEEGLEQKIQALTERIAELNTQMKGVVSSAKQLAESSKQEGVATEEQRTRTRSLADEIARLQKQYDTLSNENNEQVASLYKLKEQLREVKALRKADAQAVTGEEGSYKKLAAQYNKLKIELNKLGTEAKETNARIDTLGGRTFKEAEREAKRLYDEMNRLQAATGKHALNVGNYSSAFDGLTKKMGSFKGALASTIASWVGWTAIISTTIKLIKDAFGTMVEFERKLSSLQAVVGVNGEAMKDLSAQAIELSRNTRYTAESIVELQLAMAKLGFTADEIKASTKAVADFALATGSDTSEAAQLAVNALNIFGASAQEIDRYVSAMAVSTYRSALSFDYLQTSFSTVAPVARQFGFTIEDTLALLGTLADSGFRASEAATATRNILLRLADSNSKLAQSLKEPVTDLPSLVRGLKELEASGVDLAQTFEITDKRSVSAFNTFLKGADSILVLRDAVTDVNDEFKAAAETMDNNVAGSLQHLKASWDALMLSFSGSTGVLKSIIDVLDQAVRGWNALLTSRDEWLRQRSTTAQGVATQELYKAGGYAEEAKSHFKDMYQMYLKQGMKDAEAYKRARKRIAREIESFELEQRNRAAKLRKELPSSKFEDAGKIKQEIFVSEGLANAYAALRDDLMKNFDPREQKAENTFTTPTDPKQIEAQQRREQQERERSARNLIQSLRKELEQRQKAEKEKVAAQEEGLARTIDLDNLEVKHKQEKVDLELKIDRISKANLKDYVGFSEETIANMIKSKEDIVIEGEKKISEDIQKELVRRIEIEKATTELQLKATRANSQQQFELQRKQLEEEERLAIAQNDLLKKQGKPYQSREDIDAVYQRRRLALSETQKTNELKLQQELEDSRFNIVEHSENKAYKLRLQHEKELYQLKLEYARKDPQASADEIEIIENQIKAIDRDLKKGKVTSVWDAMGLDLSPEEQQAIEQSIGYVMSALEEVADAQVALAEKVVEAREKEVESAKSALDAELEARANGYANNVDMARRELEEKKKLQRDALNEQRKAQKQQAAIQTLEQIGNLVSATALIWKQLGFPYAIPAIATMWGSFAASKIMAANLATKQDETYGNGTVELLQGGSHQSGNDIDLGRKPDGTRRRAEGGEYFAVINKRSSRQYGGLIPDVIHSLNDGSFIQKFGDGNKPMADFAVAIGNGSATAQRTDLSKLEGDVRAIKEQYGNREYSDANGNTVRIYKNVRQVIKPS